MESNSSLLGLLPAEIQALIFGCVTLADITSISLTCHYYRLNVWAFILTLDPIALQNMVAQAADIASSAYIDDLFSEPDPRLVELSKVQQLPIFHKIFERVSLSRRKLDKFVLYAAEGFDDIKEEFFSAIEKYPSFIENVTSLTAIDVRREDLERFTKLTPHLRHLDWQPVDQWLPNRLWNLKLPSLTSIIFRRFKVIYWTMLNDVLSALPSLLSLEFIGGSIIATRTAYIPRNFKLQRLGYLNCNFVPWSEAPTLSQLKQLLTSWVPALKALDLRGSVALRSQSDLSDIQREHPNLEITLGLYDKQDQSTEMLALFTCEKE